MPRKQYDLGGRTAPGMSPPLRGEPPRKLPMRERFSAMRNLPPFLKLVWRTSQPLTIFTLILRLLRALLPVATLYVGKLIIDEVVRLVQLPSPPGTPS